MRTWVVNGLTHTGTHRIIAFFPARPSIPDRGWLHDEGFLKAKATLEQHGKGYLTERRCHLNGRVFERDCYLTGGDTTIIGNKWREVHVKY